ncbi:MAG: hypothetical protein V1690_03990 [Candidatus Moraniibacteriota bacterium]
MDKVEKQKVQSFLISADQKIKEIKDFLQLDRGDILLEEIAKFEEESAEFLQFNSAYQDELNKRKWIIQYIIFPILSDDKVEELLQYHLLEAVDLGLDLEELMKMRAITISELLWPKLSQQYLKALSQNTQLIGSEPIVLEGEKSTFLPYVKNWISVYNRRFGIEKHGGLEPHQFVLENANAQRLNKGLKESLLKIIKFYESLKVFSLSEIEGELRKMKMGAVAQQAVAYSIAKENAPGKPPRTTAPTSKLPPLPNTRRYGALPDEKPISGLHSGFSPVGLEKRIKIVGTEYKSENKDIPKKDEEIKTTRVMVGNQTEPDKKEEKPLERDVVEKPIADLMENFSALASFNITGKSINLPTAPFSLAPTAQNWIEYYQKECGKGRHSPQERDAFIEKLEKNQGLGPADALKLKKVLRSVDEKIALPYDKKNKELLLDLVKVGDKLKTEEKSEESKISAELDKIIPKSIDKPKPVKKIEPIKKEEGYLEIELVPGGKAEDTDKV